ncbi:hypothetical protein [Thalassovita taeanensis]|uniref:Major facilitator superfamily (MFS) profile domain-containing protein n=1 Tax=Thalassovita taeanensis TaxID=657014 RepID=A0A1H9ALG1_9RHOB|nr:hypothetical protein [Thalassovita taeanensis]SEP77307.1 hypothetical protein SAMN04488092_102176 [Thalassovita taeanensis]
MALICIIVGSLGGLVGLVGAAIGLLFQDYSFWQALGFYLTLSVCFPIAVLAISISLYRLAQTLPVQRVKADV